jgi:hypothetical protein
MRTRWAAPLLLAAAGCIIETPDEFPAERPTVLAVGVSPSNAVVEAGGSQQFVAMVTGNGTVPQAVTWSVRSDSQPAGTVDANGVYRVLTPVKTNARDTVVATSLAHPAIEAVATVDIPALSLSIAPATANVALGESIQLTATVHGLVSQQVNWICYTGVIPNVTSPGTIAASGLYTAPASPPGVRFVNVAALAAGGEPAGGVATIHVYVRPPVLTSASGPVSPSSTLTLFGSGFLATVGVGWQVLFEDFQGGFGGSNAYGVQDDRMLVQVPGGPAVWTGRLKLVTSVDEDLVYSNLLDAGLP